MSRDRIVISGLRVFGHHGVADEERAQEQEFAVDLECTYDAEPAGNSDELKDTIDYGWLVQIATKVVTGESCKLLETVATKLADASLENPKVEAVSVTIAKVSPPLDAPVGSISVQIERSRTAQ